MRYNPALDGIRALAALVVVLFHARVPGFSAGYLAVDVFFVLSGYLITRNLIEKPAGLWRFYIRRAARLYPPLLLMLAAFVAYGIATGGHNVFRDAGLAAIYVTDYTRALWGVPKSLTHTWSLSVEEHFYLLWPLVFFTACREQPTRLAAPLFAASLAFTAWRLFCSASGQTWESIYYRFDTHASGLALGCALGAWRIELARAWGWAGFAVIALAFCAFPVSAQNPFAISVAELGTALLLCGRWGPPIYTAQFAYLGRLSYGLYLWHYPIHRIMDANGQREWWLQAVVTLAAGIALSALSYHTVETIFRQRRSYRVTVFS